MGLRRHLCLFWVVGWMVACLPCGLSLTAEESPLRNLEETLDPCVVKTKQINIPGYPHAFNSSFLAWGKGWLLSFRNKEKVNGVWRSSIGLVELTEDFEVNGPIHFLDTGSYFSADPRLIDVDGNIYIAYSDVPVSVQTKSSRAKLEMVIGQIGHEEGRFFIHSICHLTDYPNRVDRTEKNWVPFVYANRLFLSYSLQPHRVLTCPYEDSTCVLVSETPRELPWKWGVVRGGTPAILVNGKYLSFFHSSKGMKSLHSEGKPARHYFLGAYLFDAKPPFEIEKISPKPIVGPNFYIGPNYPSYWIAIQAIFPGGVVQKGSYLWITYGRQDHEIWVAQIHTQTLLDSLSDLK